MLEVNIRIFFQKKDSGLFPDYREHISLIQTELKGKVTVYLDETDDMQIYQYYSIAPFGWIEVRYLKRMQIGKSLMCIKESIDDYIKRKHLPGALKRLFYDYLRIYLNSLDYIVVADKLVEESLKKEGVCKPQFYKIPVKKEDERGMRAFLWLNLYEKIEKEI